MTLTEQVYTQARLMGQELAEENQVLLEAVCGAAVNGLELRLRDGMTPEDCRADFVTAAALYALATMNEVGGMSQLEQLSAGELTLKQRDRNAAADRLRRQAELLMQPYVKAPLAFAGV